jgi:hypothetical protein
MGNKEEIACIKSARSQVTSEKLSKKCKMMPSHVGVGVSYPQNPSVLKLWRLLENTVHSQAAF